MNIEIKKSIKPIKYNEAIKLMEDRLFKINRNKSNELIWILEHRDVYTAGTSSQKNEIIDKSINLMASSYFTGFLDFLISIFI